MFKQNSLVAYKGGGYDGCIWEWNYVFIDEKGEFHDIYSSGVAGCKTYDKLKKLYAEHPEDFDIYELRLKRERKRLAAELPISHLLGVAKVIPYVILAKCDGCGNEFDVRQMRGDGVRSEGGTHMQFISLVCEVCGAESE